MATTLGTVAALFGLGLTALPASAGINPNTTYEYDCTTSLQAGNVAPFPVTANLNGAPDPSFPTGALWGASGAISETLAGGVVAGLESNGVVGPSGIGLNVNDLNIGPVDTTATGTPFSYSHSFAQVPPTSHTVANVTWAITSPTLNGNFAATDVGEGVTGGTGLPTGATIVAVNPGVSATIQSNTTAAQATGTTVTLWDAMTFTDAAVNTGNVFTTHGVNGGHSNVGLLPVGTAPAGQGNFGVVANLTIPFGGAPGAGTANCMETGWQNATTPGPSQTGATSPQLPFGASTPLTLASGGFVTQPGTTQAITPPVAAFVGLLDNGPVAHPLTVNLGVGGTKTVTLPQTPSNSPTTACNLVSPSPYGTGGRLAVVLSNSPTLCQATLTDSGSGPAVVTFQFNATDGLGVTGNNATVTVNIGTPPVDEPLTQNVLPGQLVVSCSSPETYLAPPAGTGTGTPLLQCPEFQFPTITLNGLEQTQTGGGSTLYVSDNRGDPAAGWSLSAYMVPTPIGPGSNTNTNCGGLADFCNANVAAHALDPNGQIAAGDLTIGSISCTPHAGNLNPAATADPGGAFGPAPIPPIPPNPAPNAAGQTTPAPGVGICSAVATQSGGTFDVHKTYTLHVPSSVYAGNYWGTVEFLVQ